MWYCPIKIPKIQDHHILMSAIAKLHLLGIFHQRSTIIYAYQSRENRLVKNVIVIRAQTISAHSRRLKADIAFIRNQDGNYDLIADFWEIQAYSNLPSNWWKLILEEYTLEMLRRQQYGN